MAIFKEILISPFDNIADKLSGLTPYTNIVFTPGTHYQAPEMNGGKDLIFIDKSYVNVIIPSGAYIKFPANTILIDRVGELAPNQSTPIADFSYSGSYTGPEYIDAAFWIKIDGNGTPDTFQWEKQTGFGEPTYTHTGIPITGAPQLLSDGVSIQIDNTTGNTIGEGQIISFGAKDQMMIRVGSADGYHEDVIDNVVISGQGTLDYNMTNNAKPTAHAIQLPSHVLFHGRLRGCSVYNLTLRDAHRAVCAYGDSDGTYNAGGSVTGGTSYNQYNTTIANLKVYNQLTDYGSGMLLGHPEHRGSLSHAKVWQNYINCDLTPLEPNFLLKQYHISDNMMKTKQKNYGIHLWRKSEDAMILNNCLVDDGTDKPVVSAASAPTGWDSATNIFKDNNLNLNSAIGN